MTMSNRLQLMLQASAEHWRFLNLQRLILILIFVLYIPATKFSAQESSPDAGSEPRPLTVWLPALLIPDEADESFMLLSEHTDVFSTNNAVTAIYRLKDVEGVGGIMSSIRSGSEVAPGALPDIALIPRRDFTPTQARQYLQSMETLFSSSLINDLDNALEIGQIPLEGNVALYGLPYFFEVLHAVYTVPMSGVDDGLSFEDVLANGARIVFPAARPTGLNQTFYLQYLAAGGSVSANGLTSIDEAALLSVLGFYETLYLQELIDPDVLSYQNTAAYQDDFIADSNQLQIGVFTSSQFLSMRDQQIPRAKPANIPTASGESLATRDAWLWVIITPDVTRQTISARFLEWMTEPGFHAAFAKSLHQLPTQPAVLRDSLPENIDHEFYAGLLSSAILPLPESEGGTAPRIMQEALIQVLQGESTAASATRQVMNQFAGR